VAGSLARSAAIFADLLLPAVPASEPRALQHPFGALVSAYESVGFPATHVIDGVSADAGNHRVRCGKTPRWCSLCREEILQQRPYRCIDHICYTPSATLIPPSGGAKLLDLKELPELDICKPLPTEQCPSDHLLIAARFELL
jgi:hypothetical protein